MSSIINYAIFGVTVLLVLWALLVVIWSLYGVKSFRLVMLHEGKYQPVVRGIQVGQRLIIPEWRWVGSVDELLQKLPPPAHIQWGRRPPLWVRLKLWAKSRWANV